MFILNSFKIIETIGLKGGEPRQRQGLVARFNGFFSPVSDHILCYDHSEMFQPLQPATVQDKENYRCCPFCKGKILYPFIQKSKKWGFKRKKKYLKTALTKYIKSCEPPEIIRKYLK